MPSDVVDGAAKSARMSRVDWSTYLSGMNDPAAPLPTKGAFRDLPNREKAAHLLDKIDDAAVPEPTGHNVLVLQYVRPEKTAGGVILAAKTLAEDEYAGAVGYVVKIGKDAYDGTATKYRWTEPGDWVMWPKMKATPTRFKLKTADGAGVVFAILTDDAFTGVGVDPDQLV